MTILVTGASGFVGRSLVPYLVTNQCEVVTLDYAEAPDDTAFTNHIQYRLGSNLGLVLPDHIKCVIHLASESHVDRSISGPAAFIDNNVSGTLELLEACRKLSHLEKFLHFSTDEVGACLTTGEMLEEYRFNCGSAYSASKGAQELLCQAYLKTYNLPIVITRSVNIFGPHQADEKFIPTVCRKAVNGDQIPIYGSGMQKRQWVYIDHVCEYVNYVATVNFIPPGSLLHITGTQEYPNILIAHTILNLLGADASLIAHVTDRLGHDERYAMGRSDKTDAFGCPKYSEEKFLEDLKSTVKWYGEKYEVICRSA